MTVDILLGAVEVRTPADARNYSGVWSLCLGAALRELGVQVAYCDPADTTTWQPARAVLLLGSLKLDKNMHRLDLQAGLARTGGALWCQTADWCPGDLRSAADVTFVVRSVPPRQDRFVSVGWAADPQVCLPNQDPDVYRVLVDHGDYVAGRGDRSADVARELTRLLDVARRSSMNVEVRWLGDGGALPWRPGQPVPPCTRRNVSWAQVCAEYGRADVFMVTHPEGVGLSVIEAATAGAMVLVPDGCIAPELLATVRHVTWSNGVRWMDAIGECSAARCRGMAMQNTWKSIATKIWERVR